MTTLSEHAKRAGEAIRLARVRKKLKQTQLADDLAISKGYLSKIESGLMPVTDELLPKLMDELDLPAKDLRPDLAELFLPKRALKPKRAQRACAR